MKLYKLENLKKPEKVPIENQIDIWGNIYKNITIKEDKSKKLRVIYEIEELTSRN